MSTRNFIIIAIAALASGCGGYSSSTPTSPTTPSTSSGSTITIGSGVSSATTNAFGANPLIVSTGTTVTWTNRDSVAHTSTANSGTWNSSNIAPGASYSFTFQAAGTYAYHCNIHPNMVGTVTVQ